MNKKRCNIPDNKRGHRHKIDINNNSIFYGIILPEPIYNHVKKIGPKRVRELIDKDRKSDAN